MFHDSDFNSLEDAEAAKETQMTTTEQQSRRVDNAVAKLCEAFGKERIIVNGQYHLSILCEGGKHEVYFSKDCLKLHLHGERGIEQVQSLTSLIRAVKSHDPHASDLHAMKAAVDLAQLVVDAKRNLGELRQAVYVDAGWKDGMAEIAAVFVTQDTHGPRVIAQSYMEPMESSEQAERFAVRFGDVLANEQTRLACPIFTDCQSIVANFRNEGYDVRCLSREKNRVADKLANMRGKRS